MSIALAVPLTVLAVSVGLIAVCLVTGQPLDNVARALAIVLREIFGRGSTDGSESE